MSNAIRSAQGNGNPTSTTNYSHSRSGQQNEHDRPPIPRSEACEPPPPNISSLFNHRNSPIATKRSVTHRTATGESAIGPRQAAPAGEQVPVARRQLPRLDIYIHFCPFVEIFVRMLFTPFAVVL